MKITRTMPDEGWVPVANTAARDHRLSWRARGLLLELLSYPDGWETTIDKLVDLARQAGPKSEGREAMRGAMAELLALGYATRTKAADKHGKWSTHITISDAPGGQNRDTGSRASVDEASDSWASVDRASEDRASIETRTTNTDTNTDLDSKNAERDSASLTSFAVAADTATQIDPTQQMLDRIYDRIDKLTDEERRGHLLVAEAKRPRIYREARNAAVKQLKNNDPRVLKSNRAVEVTDKLSYKWIAVHYVSTTGELPVWFARPMGLAA